MKKNYYLLLVLTSLYLISCTGEKSYQPIQGYKGMIKRIVSYNYESDFQKNKIISKFGTLIPKHIDEYNQYGNPTMNLSLELPDDDDEQVCIIYLDSITYNKKQEQESIVSYTIYTNNNDIQYYNEPQKLINSNTTFVSKETTKNHITQKGNSETRIRISTQSNETKNMNNISNAIHNVIKKRSQYYNEVYLNFTPQTDTVSTVYLDYKDKKIRHEKHEGYLSKDITYYYDKDLLSKKITITPNDTTETTYSYKNGYLWETKTGDIIERYDNKGRSIYYKTNKREEIHIYKGDSIKISSTSNNHGNHISFSKVNQDSLNVFSASLDLADEKFYNDDVIMNLEKFANNEISQEKLMDEIEQIIYKIDDSNYNSFTSTIYSNYDTHNNPLKIEESKTTMMNNYSMFSNDSNLKYYLDKKVIKRERKDITEKEIEYF